MREEKKKTVQPLFVLLLCTEEMMGLYLFLVLLTGIVLSVMISINGTLSSCYNALSAAAIIHLVGSVAAVVMCLVRKERRPLFGHSRWWMYLGGAVGVLTTLGQNYAFTKISMTSLVALGLLGQTVTSLLVDRFGLFGMERHPFKKSSFIGLCFALIGIYVMMGADVAASAAAVITAFVCGICVVVSRTFNSRLAENTGALISSAAAHISGFLLTLALALSVSGSAAFVPVAAGASRPWIYAGGILGVSVIILCNVTVPRVSAFRLTLLTFVGQIFTGILLDVLTGRTYSDVSFSGGLIIAAGIAVNMATEKLLEDMKKRS